MKKILLTISVVFLLILLVPVPGPVYRDGGTREYKALAYKIVVWNRLVPDGIYHKVSFYLFPDSLRSIDDLWDKEGYTEPEESTYHEDPGPDETPAPEQTGGRTMLVMEANGITFRAELEENSSAAALAVKLSSGPMEIALRDYGSFEKVGPLPWKLPQNDKRITTAPGDVILYQGDQITIYYDENTWSFTKLAHIDGVTREDLLNAFGDGSVTVRFSVEQG